MRQEVTRKIKTIAGIACIILGFLALVTPLTPGSWLIFVGAEILGIRFLSRGKFEELLKKARNRFFKKDIEKDANNESPKTGP